ncbi:hypothetical protein myaer102_10690 [Microcystis viridis NIES-102]|uniref:Uncharacterized protein n=1 Tax=Microcystis viridis NIES-102 TaxID=213615 RepID=A0A3G9JD97_MICVR|nr:hypothetical protein myaer102_10690 [Microcystis viridis NIES-102]
MGVKWWGWMEVKWGSVDGWGEEVGWGSGVGGVWVMGCGKWGVGGVVVWGVGCGVWGGHCVRVAGGSGENK